MFVATKMILVAAPANDTLVGKMITMTMMIVYYIAMYSPFSRRLTAPLSHGILNKVNMVLNVHKNHKAY